MGTMDSDGFSLLRRALMGIAFISKGWGTFFPHCSFEVEDDSTIFFWHDRWCSEIPLKDLFLSLYILAVDRNASVADYWEQISSNNIWAPLFLRD